MYYYTYQTKNLVTGKTYVGLHQTKKLSDGYIGHGIKKQSDAERMKKKGSRSLFVLAVCKYGYQNFATEVLSFFDSREQALAEEAFLVDQNWVKNQDNYNTSLGGLGFVNQKLTASHIDVLRDISAKEYIVANLETKEIWKVKNLTQFERERIKEFGHSEQIKKTISKLNTVANNKCLVVNDKWWACKIQDFTGEIPTLEEIKAKRIQGYKNGNIAFGVGESNKKRAKTYYFKTPDNVVVKVDHLPSFCKEHNLNCTCMNRLNSGVIKTHKGWTAAARKDWNC